MSIYNKCKNSTEFTPFQSGCSKCDWLNPAKYYNTQGWSTQNYQVTGGKTKRGGSKRGVCSTSQVGPSKPSDLQYNGPFNMTEANWAQMLTGEGVPAKAQDNQAVQAENVGTGYFTQGGVKKTKGKKTTDKKDKKVKKPADKKVKKTSTRKHRGGNPNAGATSMPAAFYDNNAARVSSTANKAGKGFPCNYPGMTGGNPNAGATYMPPQFYNPRVALRTGNSSTGSSFPCNNLTPTDPLFQHKGGNKCPVNTSTSKCENTQTSKAQMMNCNLADAKTKNDNLASNVRGAQTGGTGDKAQLSAANNRHYAKYMDAGFDIAKYQLDNYYRSAKGDYSSATGGKKSRKNQKAGGSDFVMTFRSRGPVNYPNQDPKQFHAFTKTGEYIPNNDLAYAAAPMLTGCMADNSPVQGYNIGDYVTGGAKKKATKKPTGKKTPTKKTSTKKTSDKKKPTKKSTGRKTPVKKPTTKKSTGRKTPAKKVVRKSRK